MNALASLIVLSAAASELGPVAIPQHLESAYEQVAQRVSFPIVLPTEIPNVTDVGIGDFRITPEGHDSEDRYAFLIDSTAGCDNGGWCPTGSFGGEMLEGSIPLVEMFGHVLTLPPDSVSGEPWQEVLLVRDIQGVYVPWEKMDQCSEARVYWEQEDYRYYVGLPCGSLADLAAFANSIIENQPNLED